VEKQKLAAIATVIVLISAGTAMAAYMVLSDILDYDVTVEGSPIILVEVSGPSTTLARGSNHTFHATATVESGSWNTWFVVNVTSTLITDSSHLSDYKVYLNDTSISGVHDTNYPNLYQNAQPLGVLNQGDVVEFYWTIYFSFDWPVGDYHLDVYVDGQAA
jgi:hypothetical protein